MDPAKNKTLGQITDAIGAIQHELEDPMISVEKQEDLEAAINNLRTIQNDIIENSEQALVNALSGKSDALNKFADQIKKDADQSDQIATTIKNVADAIGNLVSITTAAM